VAKKILFTRNYADQSTDKGFQFEFYCDRCGTGYRTGFKPYALGTVTGAIDAAGSFFGGVLARTAGLVERARSASWEKAHDSAFLEAMDELKPDFIQCPRCSSWVCRDKCWNVGKGLCKVCAPDLSVEMAAAQANRTVEEIWAHSKMAQEDRKMLQEKSWRQGVRATCPACGVPLPSNSKFCPECGSKIVNEYSCVQCGAKITGEAKFCPECGTKIDFY
jgi:membrane protease subunit (stomatin/prohibitin family)